MKQCLIDTGPLVAYLSLNDPEHVRVAACLDTITGQLCTTSAVVTEAMHFVSEHRDGPGLLSQFVTAAAIQVFDFAQPSVLGESVKLMRKYADTPMDYADATLVLLADYLGVSDIATLDRRGFSTYRWRGKRSFRIVPE